MNRRMQQPQHQARADFNFDTDRDQRWVTIDDNEVIELMPAWTGGQSDPLYAISSSGGANYAWVFQDAIANLDADIAKVKKLGKDKYQLGKGTFTKKEIYELHTIRDALVMALEDPDLPHLVIREARETHHVADFNTIPEIIAHAQQEGATHVKTVDGETKIYFPRQDGQYEEACVWTEGGYWHTHAPGNRVVLGCLPPGAEPIETHGSQVEGQVVTSNRRPVGVLANRRQPRRRAPARRRS
jgi:hypothetical protein